MAYRNRYFWPSTPSHGCTTLSLSALRTTGRGAEYARYRSVPLSDHPKEICTVMNAAASAPSTLITLSCPHCTLVSRVVPEAWGWECGRCKTFVTFRLCPHCGHAAQIEHSRKKWDCPSCGRAVSGLLKGGKATFAEVYAREPAVVRAPFSVLASCASCRRLSHLQADAVQERCDGCGADGTVRVCAQCRGVVLVSSADGEWTCSWCRHHHY